MQEVARVFGTPVRSTFDLDSALGQILSIACNRFQLAHGAVFLLDPAANELWLRSSIGWSTQAELRIPVGKGISGQAAQLNRVLCVPDVRKHDGHIPVFTDTRSELALPLIASDKVVGVLDLQSDQEEFFGSDTVELLAPYSTHAALALSHAWLQEHEQKRATQLDTIAAIARQTTAVTELHELLARFCALLLQSFPVDHVALLLVEDERLVLRAHSGKLWLLIPEGHEVPTNTGLCGRALATQNPVLSNDVKNEAQYVDWFAGVKSELCLPLVSFGQPLGVLALSSASQDAFDASDLRPLESVADICGAVIQNAMHFDKVRYLAYRDGLTGVFNRRFFEMRAAEETERARRYRSVVSLLMIDLDGFKVLNDKFGHMLGDEVLRQISSVFVQQLRKMDIICRFGGDEFAVLLPETVTDKAYRAAEKLRCSVAELQLPEVTCPIGLSIGVASCPEDGKNRDELVKAADDALYRAKQGGRNRVVVAQRTPSGARQS
jgi:diguanylate cyclase (GGDEF)-like protein